MVGAMRTFASVVLVGLVLACAGNIASQVASSPSPLTYQQLAARTMKLPALGPGQPCSANSITLEGGTAPRIGTHLRLGFGGAGPRGGFAWNKTVWDRPTTPGLPNVLLRGARLDGPGRLYFEGDGNGPSDASRITVADPRGGQSPFYSDLRLPVDSSAAFYTYPTTPGCYAIQAESDGFSEVIIFGAT